MTVLSVRAQCVRSASRTSRQGRFLGAFLVSSIGSRQQTGQRPTRPFARSEWGDRRSRSGGAVGQRGSGGATCQARDLSMGPGSEETSGTISPMQASLLCFCFALERRLSVSQQKESWNLSSVPSAELARHLSLPGSHYPDRLTARPGSLIPTQRKPANRIAK